MRLFAPLRDAMCSPCDHFDICVPLSRPEKAVALLRSGSVRASRSLSAAALRSLRSLSGRGPAWCRLGRGFAQPPVYQCAPRARPDTGRPSLKMPTKRGRRDIERTGSIWRTAFPLQRRGMMRGRASRAGALRRPLSRARWSGPGVELLVVRALRSGLRPIALKKRREEERGPDLRSGPCDEEISLP